jgi:alpha-L-rhamnosidase
MADNIDARDFPYGWSEVGFDDSAWKPVKVKATVTDISASPIENMYEYEMPVESIVDKGNGNYFITLEKEIVGGLRLALPDGVEGATLTMLYGEEANGTSVKWALNTLNIYREFWTLKDGAQVIENFGMKCFRYIEIQNSPVAITADMVKGIAYRQDFDRNDSSFESSNELINKIYELTKYTIEATNQDIYTDSQTRERSQHNSGDVYINVKTSHAMSRDYTLALYTARYMNQLDYYISEYNIHAILTAWDLYNYLGDKSIIENDYDAPYQLMRTGYFKRLNVNGKEIISEIVSLKDNFNAKR